MIAYDDSPRTRELDPLTSHLAGDRSQTTVHDVREAVEHLFTHVDAATGSALNELYRAMREQHGWPEVHFDSPRKRAGELAADGVLAVENADASRGTERIFRLKEPT